MIENVLIYYFVKLCNILIAIILGRLNLIYKLNHGHGVKASSYLCSLCLIQIR